MAGAAAVAKMPSQVGARAEALSDDPANVQQLKSVVAAPLPPMIAPLRFTIVAQLPEVQQLSSTGDASKPSFSQSVYRGSFPRTRHLFFLRRLRIKTILSLTPKPIEAVDKEVWQWCQENGVKVFHIRCDKPKDDGGGLSRENAAKAMTHILDRRNLPLYVHCLDGQSVSTLAVAVLRKIQAWSSPAIQNEMARWLGRDEEILTYQSGFVEKFGKPDGVRLPPRRFMPDWIWPDPSALGRLRNPYDVIAPMRDRQQEKGGAGVVESAGWNGQFAHKRQISTDTASISSSNGSGAGAGSSQYGAGSLPVQHPTLKLRFDVDHDLPPPPVLASHSNTPLLGHSRDSSAFLSPSPSRPTSRTDRAQPHHTTSHVHHSHHQYNGASHGISADDPRSRASSRASSRPGSPPPGRRRDVQTTPDAYRLLGDPPSSHNSSPDRPAPHVDPSSRASGGLASSTSPLMDSDFRLPAAARPSNAATPFGAAVHHATALQHQPHVHSHLNDVFFPPLSASQTATPRASFSQGHPVAARPQSFMAGDLASGLGLRADTASTQSPSAGLLRPPSSRPSTAHAALTRSVSDRYVAPSELHDTSLIKTPSNDGDRSEYFSDPGSGDEGEIQRRERRLSRHSNDVAGSGGDEDKDEDEVIDEEDDEVTDEVDGEDEEDEVLSEEEDEDENDSDDLALEALDLEGY